MSRPYDKNNIFAQILRGEAPYTKIYEDEWVLAFEDIAQMAPIHVLVIPKKPYINLQDFITRASRDEIGGYWKGIANTIEVLGLDRPGFNLFTSVGEEHGQDVFHFHVHITSGKPLPDVLHAT